MQNQADLMTYMNSRRLKDNTRQTYLNTFNKVAEQMEHEIIFKTINIIQFRDIFNKIDLSNAIKYKFLSVLNVIRPNEVVISRLLTDYKYKEKVQSDQRTEQVASLEINFNDLQNDLQKEKNPTYYTLKYLLLTFGVRNQDLVVKITYDKNYFDKNRDTENLLFYDKNRLIYSRGNYKTKSIFGVIAFDIEDSRFKDIVNTKDEGDYLLVKTTKKPYEAKDISVLINRIYGKSFKNIKFSESIIYKMIINHYRNDNKMLSQYANSRPHSQQTQLTTYTP